MAIMDLFFPPRSGEPPATERSSHWNNVYATKADDQVSWFEASAELSLRLIAEAGLAPSDVVVDVGGGASTLVDSLVARGRSVTVLDLSAEALAHSRRRLGPAAERVDWVVSDVTRWAPEREYGLWHDRAAFHFLTLAEDQDAYAKVLGKALRSGGAAIIGTFAPDGPEKCSGLPVARHDGASIARVLGPGFRLVDEIRHEHTTPWGSVQKFQFSTLRKL